MLRTMIRSLMLAAAAVLTAGPLVVLSAEDEGFVSLFNGQDLEGWEQRNGTATYRVEEGCVVGKTSDGSPNSFLCTKQEYADFELRFEVKVDDALNSGVQFRSKSKGDTPEGRVHGPQVEISTDKQAGRVYGEALDTGWLSKAESNEAARNAFKNGEWNSYVVKAHGKHIQTWVNGVPVADFEDAASNMPKGFIGLQVHGIAKGAGPFEVRWRNIRLREAK